MLGSFGTGIAGMARSDEHGRGGAGHARDKKVYRDAGTDSFPPCLNALIFQRMRRVCISAHYCSPIEYISSVIE